MRRLAILLLLVLALAPSLEARRRAAAKPVPLSLPAVDAIAAQAIGRGIPGVSIAIRKGNDVFARGYGLHDVELNVPVSTASEFQIGSVTKQFTAAAVMLLIEQGKLSLDDKARRYLPELDERFDAITIRHLLQHTSGLRDYNVQLGTPYVPKTQQEIIALITVGPPMFTPGTRWRYSNSGYYLLGVIIERAGAKTYESFLRDAFFEPLGLARTSYCDSKAPPPDGYFHYGGTLTRLPAASMSLPYAAGALCSTALDLVQWNEALISGRAVSAQSYAKMTNDLIDLGPSIAYGYALLVDTLDGRKRVWHNGDILGFETALYWFPEEDLTIAVAINYIDLEGDVVSPIADAIARALK
jgi:D-alanyl-D-alanine carboxypeptidase